MRKHKPFIKHKTLLMKTKLIAILCLAAGTTFFSSCNQDGCTDPNAINYDPEVKNDDGSCVYGVDTMSAVTLHAHSKMGAADFAYDTEVTNWEGRKVKFTLAQMYLSNFSFRTDDGTNVPIDDSYILIKPGTMMYELGELPNDHYSRMDFMFGVDSVANNQTDPASWPSDHALSANNPDHAFWVWNSGYIFVKVEGMVDTTADMSGTPNAPFVYHIGTNMLAKDLSLMAHEDIQSDVTVGIEVDYLQLFDGIDLRVERDSHTMNNMPAAQALSNNVPSAITLD